MAVHAAPHVFRMLALEQMGRAGGELDHLDAALHRTRGVGQGLAMLLARQLHQLIAVLLHQFAEAGEDAPAPQRRRRAPAGKGRPRRPHRALDIGRAGQGDLAHDLAGRRVEHVAAAPAGSGLTLTIDPELNNLHGYSFQKIFTTEYAEGTEEIT
jgi:hypothetical protein